LAAELGMELDTILTALGVMFEEETESLFWVGIDSEQ
jgi:hypothetical protein